MGGPVKNNSGFKTGAGLPQTTVQGGGIHIEIAAGLCQNFKHGFMAGGATPVPFLPTCVFRRMGHGGMHTGNGEFTEGDREMTWGIGHARLSRDRRIETKYGLGTVRNLSSGCRVMLNVMKNPGKVVNVVGVAGMCRASCLPWTAFPCTWPGRNGPEYGRMPGSASMARMHWRDAGDMGTGGQKGTGGIWMVYDAVRFDAAPFSCCLESEERIILVRGDSATGRTFLYRMLEDVGMTEEYRAARLSNYKTEDFHGSLVKCRGRLAVIGNADLLLDDGDRESVNSEPGKQYMLSAGNCGGLDLSAGSPMLPHGDGCRISLKKGAGGLAVFPCPHAAETLGQKEQPEAFRCSQAACACREWQALPCIRYMTIWMGRADILGWGWLLDTWADGSPGYGLFWAYHSGLRQINGMDRHGAAAWGRMQAGRNAPCVMAVGMHARMSGDSRIMGLPENTGTHGMPAQCTGRQRPGFWGWAGCPGLWMAVLKMAGSSAAPRRMQAGCWRRCPAAGGT